MEGTTVTLASLLADAGTIFTSVMGWVGTVLSTITSNPLLLMFVIGSFAFVGIGVVKRLLNTK